MLKNKEENKILKYIIRLAVAALVVAGIIALIPSAKKASNAETVSEGIAYIKAQEAKEPFPIEEELRKKTAQEEMENALAGMNVWEKINYFGTYIMGDSRVVGFCWYDWDQNRIFAEASTTIKYIEERIDDIANAKPANLVLSFGMNDLGMYEFDPEHYWETGEDYAEAYKGYIDMIHEVSPDTQVYVNLIMPAMEAGTVRQDRWLLVDDFNASLINMCEENGIPYVDMTQICYSNPQFYAEDGVHFWGDIYDIWADEIVSTIESTLE